MDTHWIGCEMCCHCCFQRAGPAGQSGPTVIPTEPSCVCVTVMSCFPLETSVQETAAKPGRALLTPILYQVITHTLILLLMCIHASLFSLVISCSLMHDSTHKFEYIYILHHPPPYAHSGNSVHFQESCDNEIHY